MRLDELRVGDFITRPTWHYESKKGYEIVALTKSSVTIKTGVGEQKYIISDNDWIVVSKEEEYGELKLASFELRVGDRHKFLGTIEWTVELPNGHLAIGFTGRGCSVYSPNDKFSITRINPNPDVSIIMKKKDAQRFVEIYDYWFLTSTSDLQRTIVNAVSDALSE